MQARNVENGQYVTTTRDKKCPICGNVFHSRNPLQKYCTAPCAWQSLQGRISKKRNGKMIACKTCGKEVYVSGSRIGATKYCSRECAKKDKYGFKPRSKKCSECGNSFIIDSQLRMGEKYCSDECRHDVALRKAKENDEKLKHVFIDIICRGCGKKATVSVRDRTKYCSRDCRFEHSSRLKTGKNNFNYKNGSTKHAVACRLYKKAFLKLNEYLYCEICGKNVIGSSRFEVHHIYHASLYPKHKELHNFLNLVLLCKGCHIDIHAGKLKKEHERLEKERGLKNLFKKA